MNTVLTKEEQLGKLRKEILELQGLRVPLEKERTDMGLGIINTAFPNHTFPLAGVHEFISAGAEDAAATAGFIAGLLGTLMHKGPCIWVSNRCTTFPPALKIFGIPPDQVIFVHAASVKDALWIMEESLKCSLLASVVAELSELTFTASRRLQLAVEESRVTGFVHHYTSKEIHNVACISRWYIKPAESYTENGMPGIGMPSWKVQLQKIRNGKPGSWLVTWSPEGFRVAVPAVPVYAMPTLKTG